MIYLEIKIRWSEVFLDSSAHLSKSFDEIHRCEAELNSDKGLGDNADYAAENKNCFLEDINQLL